LVLRADEAERALLGGGHARHLCKACHKLGADEVEYRQAVRDIDRMFQWETGRLKRKHRTNFARFLRHPSERIRRYAEALAVRDAQPGIAASEGLSSASDVTEIVWDGGNGDP